MPRTCIARRRQPGDDRRDSRGPRRRAPRTTSICISSTGFRGSSRSDCRYRRDRENIRRRGRQQGPLPVLPTVHKHGRHPVQRAWRGHFTRGRQRGRRSRLMGGGRGGLCLGAWREPLGSNSLLDLVVFGREAARALRARVAEGYGAPRLQSHAVSGALARLDRLRQAKARAHGRLRLDMQPSCKATPRYFAPANP